MEGRKESEVSRKRLPKVGAAALLALGAALALALVSASSGSTGSKQAAGAKPVVIGTGKGFGEVYAAKASTLKHTLFKATLIPKEKVARNIALAGLGRADRKVNEALALKCWKNNGCKTGTGGKLKVAYLEQFGENVYRQMSKMEFILQALTYPQIGEIIYSSAHVDFNKAFADWKAAIAQGVDVIVTYPDFGDAMIPVMKEATDAGIPVATYAWGYVSDPGKNYLTVVGEDTCVTGKTWAYTMNNRVKSGKIAFLGGFAGNPLSEGWQKCEEPCAQTEHRSRREGTDGLESVQGAAGRGRNPREESRHQGLELRVRARHGPGRVRGIQGRGHSVQHRPDTPYGRRRHGLPLQPAQEPEARDVLHQLLQLAYPGRPDGRDDEAQGSEDPAEDRVPDRAAEPAGARLLRQGLSDGGLGDVAHPAEPAQEDVPVGRTGSRRPRPSMSTPGPARGGNTVSPASPVLSLRGVSKAFGAVQALREVSVDCRAGEIHALVGENGSGKSTLLGIASGFLAPDEGTVVIGETERRRVSPAGSRKLGLGIAYQTYSHVLPLSVAENLYLAAPSDHRPTYGRMDGWAADRLAEFGLDLPPTAPTGALSLAERQLLEVVKALLAQPKVLLLDEPTTALGPEDVDRLHALVHERSRAGVGIVYVSHRLPEVLGIADRISVLRDGVCQGTFEAASMSEESLVALMIGRPLQLAFPPRHERETEREVLLAVSGLRGDRFGPIDLEVASGEIVGIAGAEGNGQVQFLRALAGAERATGTATCDGKELDSSSPLGPLRAGVVLLSGDRASESLFGVLSVRANATVQVLRRLGRLGFLNRRRERRTVDDLVRRLSIRTASIEQSVQTLSGGNQQKVSLTRPFLRGDVKVILAEEPTQGVDVAARFDIYGALRQKAKEGVATIVKSSDPLELAGLCDRVVVMSRGRIVDEIPGEELGERRIVEAIVGSRAGARGQATESPEESA